MKIPCPYCNTEMLWSTDNPWRPFCSERCKMLDLGHWVEERYSIADESEHNQEESGEEPHQH